MTIRFTVIALLSVWLSAAAATDLYDAALASFAKQDYANAQKDFAGFCARSQQDLRLHDAEWYNIRCFYETGDFETFKVKSIDFRQKYPKGDCTTFLEF